MQTNVQTLPGTPRSHIVVPLRPALERIEQESQLDKFFWELKDGDYILQLHVVVEGEVWFDLLMGRVSHDSATGLWQWSVEKDAIQFHHLKPYNEQPIYEELDDAMCCAFEHITAEFA